MAHAQYFNTVMMIMIMMESVFDFIIPVQNFKQHSPKKFQGPKTCNIWRDFGRLQPSTANISGTDKDIQNRTSTFSTVILPALEEESLTNFGPLITEI